MVDHSPVDPPTARLDLQRSARVGQPEVIYAAGKTPEQVASLLEIMLGTETSPVLATKATPAHASACAGIAVYDEAASLLVARSRRTPAQGPWVAIVSAGTSDLNVAYEASGTLAAFGLRYEMITDVGVAGINRVLAVTDQLRAADVCIVVAGMEGALPSVVAGLIGTPVIAVPTSVGYGAAFEGMAALLGMLSSCAPGISVVNIDNGFGAALVADRILRVGRSSEQETEHQY